MLYILYDSVSIYQQFHSWFLMTGNGGRMVISWKNPCQCLFAWDMLLEPFGTLQTALYNHQNIKHQTPNKFAHKNSACFRWRARKAREKAEGLSGPQKRPLPTDPFLAKIVETSRGPQRADTSSLKNSLSLVRMLRKGRSWEHSMR